MLLSARANLQQLRAFLDREEANVSCLQAWIEAISGSFGSSVYFVAVVVFITGWIVVNEWGAHAGWALYDEPPFFWLQRLVSANALLLTVSVLIRQNRMSKQAARRAHLDLHVNLLTEERVSKVLEMVAELSKAIGKPSASDAEIGQLAKAADPHAVLTAIKASDRDPERPD